MRRKLLFARLLCLAMFSFQFAQSQTQTVAGLIKD